MEEEPELTIPREGAMRWPAEEEGMPRRQTIADLMSPPCPNAPPDARPSLFPDGECCQRLHCVFCPAAGCEWTTGFGLHGHWRKKPTQLEKFGPPLDPRAWRKLPPELLPLILARIPTDGIARARALSKAWKQALTSSPDITKECSKSQPTLCALMSFSVATKLCWVRAYDRNSLEWHSFNVHTIPAMYSTSITFTDAGLACFVATGVGVQPIFLCNPLTKQWRQLPCMKQCNPSPKWCSSKWTATPAPTKSP